MLKLNPKMLNIFADSSKIYFFSFYQKVVNVTEVSKEHNNHYKYV